MVAFWWTLAVGWWLHHAGLTRGTHSRQKGREQRGWVAKARGHDGSQWPWVRDRRGNHYFFSWQMCMIAVKLPPWRVLFLVRHDWSKRYRGRKRERIIRGKNCCFIFKEGGRGRGSLQLVHGGCTVIVVVDAFLYLEKRGIQNSTRLSAEHSSLNDSTYAKCLGQCLALSGHPLSNLLLSLILENLYDLVL